MPHELLSEPSTFELAKSLTVSDVHARFLVEELHATNRRKSTVSNIERSVRRFDQWWSTISDTPLPISVIRRKHLNYFRKWLHDTGNSVSAQNEACRTIRQVLLCAVRNEVLEHAPRIERLHHRSVAPKVFQSDDEIDRLWAACKDARWPRRDSSGEPLHYSPTAAWRSAIVMFRTYGFRTQELIRHEVGFRSLKWASIFRPGITPNPVGRCECPTGWLSYVPQKQERVKPDPLVVPLTRHAMNALRRIVPPVAKRENPIFDWPLSSVGFYTEWHRLNALAGIKPREGSGVPRYLPKHFRKAATTAINLHRSGMAEHVIGHGADRSGQSSISSRHYDNAEAAVLDCMATLPMPKSFDTMWE